MIKWKSHWRNIRGNKIHWNKHFGDPEGVNMERSSIRVLWGSNTHPITRLREFQIIPSCAFWVIPYSRKLSICGVIELFPRNFHNLTLDPVCHPGWLVTGERRGTYPMAGTNPDMLMSRLRKEFEIRVRSVNVIGFAAADDKYHGL